MRAPRGSLQKWLDRADELGATGHFFETHEELEIPWKTAEGDEKMALQGLIQIAAGLHRWRLNPQKTAGASYLLDRGLEKLRRAESVLASRSVRRLEKSLRELRTARRPPEKFRFGLAARLINPSRS